jgi:uncharacterized protein (DUF885 family)
MLNRRELLAGMAGASVIMVRPQAAASTPAAQLEQLLERLFQHMLDQSPETVTSLGLDNGPSAYQKSQLDDCSAARAIKAREETTRQLAELKRIDRAQLSGMDAVNYDAVVYLWERVDDIGRRFAFGSPEWASPYVVSQLDGSYQRVPDFLDSQHTIETPEDAEAYLARLQAFATAVDQESERVQLDADQGTIAPTFVLAKALLQLKALRAMPAADTVLVRSLVRRAAEKGLSGDWGGRAKQIVETQIAPALEGQIATLERLRAQATHEAGVWKLRDGDAFYQSALGLQTTTSLSADEIHQLGLEQVSDLSGRIDAVLRQQGLTQGSVSERIQELGRDPRFLYPNTDEGRALLLAELNAQIKTLQGRLPRVFGALPRAAVEVKRVPPEIEAGAPGGYYQPPSLDGSRPGAYYINLRDTAEWPKWTLPTLTYHEASPGHHLQLTLALEAENLPLLRRVLGFTAYAEGWALYAEQLADELGMYAGDPFGYVGYLQSFLFRAARLVVDTGLHAKRWTREQAIDWMGATTGDPESAVITEVERYCVWPGQACSYKVGHQVWLRVRESAKARLGDRFDIRGFHDAALLSGAMPLEVLERVIENWAASAASGLHTARKRDLPTLGVQRVLDWGHRGKEEGRH